MGEITVSLFQYPFTSREKVQKLIKNKLKSIKTDLFILPELSLHPYFCRVQNIDNFKYANYYEQDISFFSKLAKKYKTIIVASLFERKNEGIYYNTAVIFENDGTIAGKYKKSHIPHDDSFYEKYYFTPSPDKPKIIKTSIGNIALMICYDQWFPELARVMALLGADIFIYPTAIGSMKNDSKKETKLYIKAWENIQKSHSIANQIPLISVNRVGVEGNHDNKIKFWGKSFVSNYFGEIIKQANKKEKLISIKMNLKDNKKIKQLWPFFRDRRVELYKYLLKK